MNVTITDNSTQGLFQAAIAGVLSQGMRCVDGTGSCAYRSDDRKNACAVGYLIDESLFEEFGEMGGDGITSDNVQLAVKETIGRHLSDMDVYMLTALQNAHDRSQDNAPEVLFTAERKTDLNKSAMAKFLCEANAYADQHGLQRYHQAL